MGRQWQRSPNKIGNGNCHFHAGQEELGRSVETDRNNLAEGNMETNLISIAWAWGIRYSRHWDWQIHRQVSVSVRTKTAVRVQKHSFIDKPTSPSPGRISKDWYKFLYNHSQHNYNTTPPFITALHSPSLESTPDHTGHGHTERERH